MRVSATVRVFAVVGGVMELALGGLRLWAHRWGRRHMRPTGSRVALMGAAQCALGLGFIASGVTAESGPGIVGALVLVGLSLAGWSLLAVGWVRHRQSPS